MSDTHSYSERKLIKLLQEIGCSPPELCSNHLTPTGLALNSNRIEGLFKKSNSVADTMAVKRKTLTSNLGFPYRPARLVNHKDQSKPWYIIFYAWDFAKQKIVRKRILKNELSEIASLDERLQYANAVISQINKYLGTGMYVEGSPEKKLPGFDFHGYSIIEAIDYAINYKLQVEGVKESSIGEYVKLRTTVQQFLKLNNLPTDYKVRLVNNNFINRFFPYLKETRNIANNTYNARRTTFHAVLQALIKKAPKLFPNGNPIADVKVLKTDVKKHAAYTNEQMQKIQKEILAAGDKQLLLFIQFMLYTLGRPKEVEHLKVGHVRLNERRIQFQSETAKTRIEEYVGINDRLATIIKQSGILNSPEEHYIFTADGKPGPIHVGKNYFYKRIVKYIEDLGLYNVNQNYTLYSFKHTGAISLYQATKDIKLLQAQCRHQNIEMTNNYLRDLGLFRNFDLLNKWEGPL